MQRFTVGELSLPCSAQGRRKLVCLVVEVRARTRGAVAKVDPCRSQLRALTAFGHVPCVKRQKSHGLRLLYNLYYSYWGCGPKSTFFYYKLGFLVVALVLKKILSLFCLQVFQRLFFDLHDHKTNQLR